ncbi:MAG TPA: hypothetical protein VK308_08935 [Pyrinomonadaceae bacterium]|nr:hypothetical protein [Pyrinomonadaceae bacterium]
MDTESKNVTRFLEAWQTSRERLGTVLRNELILKGAASATPFLVLSGRPFRIHDADSVREFSGSVALGVQAKPQTGEPVEFGIDILWDKTGWSITTEIYVECEEGQKLLRSFPEKHTTNLDDCLVFLEAAISELLTCVNLIDEEAR